MTDENTTKEVNMENEDKGKDKKDFSTAILEKKRHLIVLL